VDSIWYAAGDRATDFGFYTKRALLAAVYGATVLYWLEDRSPGSAATWEFLDRRIESVMRLPRLRGRLTRVLGRRPMRSAPPPRPPKPRRRHA
jgi:ubiquinone biosynthesis protein COQ9